MRFVNLTCRTVRTKFTGFIAPGRSENGNADSRKLEKALAEIVDACGDSCAICLSDREVNLINKVMDLDERGGKFDPSSIPADIRNDPSGVKRASERSRAAQQAGLDADKHAHEEQARREAVINGEVSEREPKGLATMKGEPVDESKLKSGFESIMEANARIERGEDGKGKDIAEVLDPIGAHMKDREVQAPPDEGAQDMPDAAPPDADPVPTASGREDDGTRSADTEVPEPQAPDRSGAMDKSAAEVARKLSVVGPDTDPKGKGAGKRKGQSAKSAKSK